MPDKGGSQRTLSEQRLRLLYEAAEQLGTPLTKEDVIKRYEALERGLPAEDEFVALVSWLGKCTLVHKLEQKQYPRSSKNLFLVPDLFTVFKHKNHSIPTLVEVKTTRKPSFKWSQTYFDKLKRYADLLNLPLLIAWKFRPEEDSSWAFWTLFDTSAFVKPYKSYKMTFEIASRESLLGELAGDYFVDIKAGVGLHFQTNMIRTETDWQRMRDSNKYFGKVRLFWTGEDGNEIDSTQLPPELLSLLNCVPPISESSYRDISLSTSIMSFALPENYVLPAQQMLPILLTQSLTPEAMRYTKSEFRWRNVLEPGNLPLSAREILRAIEKPESGNIVNFILHPLPKTTPTFLFPFKKVATGKSV